MIDTQMFLGYLSLTPGAWTSKSSFVGAFN